MLHVSTRRGLAMGSVVSLLGLFALGALPMAAQNAPTHPANIHRGSCAQLDPTPQFPLPDVGPRTTDDETPNPQDFKGLESAIPVEVSSKKIDVKLDDLLTEAHAISVQESAQNVKTSIACGDLGGYVIDDTLIVGLVEQNDSGYSGVAILHKDNDKTQVDIHMMQRTPPAGGTPSAATPVETTVPVGSPEVAPSGSPEATPSA